MEDIQREQSGEGRIRIDQLLVRKGLAKSREKAKEWILAGLVLAEEKPVRKPSDLISPEVEIRILPAGEEYVSRGGKKLAGALEGFGLSVEGLICLDAGASTGGFTDCLLKHGASKVFAVDVGTGQLDKSLLEDPRVTSMENTNIRTMDPSEIEPCDFFCADLSFISLKLVLASLRKLVREEARGVVLVKPQFEAGKAAIGKGGIVKDPKVHVRVLEDVIENAGESGFEALSLMPSPIRGGDGNTEYLLLLSAAREVPSVKTVSPDHIRETVRLATIRLSMKEKQRG
ncbi:MAG: TlyA family RNA methyltransferase [Firmicutes bacterium]|nr:TlyA family RNA methyltransferase [Bacillota bacterium]